MRAKNTNVPLYILRIFLLVQFKHVHSNVIHNITWTQTLSHGQTLVSPNRDFELGFFNPINSSNQYVGIWYRAVSPKTVVWVANREKPLKVTDSLASLKLSKNGNLELIDGLNDTLWSTNTSALSSSLIAELEDSGNFVLRNVKSREELWKSFEVLGDTFLSGSVLGFNNRTGETKVLTSWNNEADPSPGIFSFGISKQRPSQAFVWVNGSVPRWRSGLWDKSKFIGIPEMVSSYQSPFSIQEDPNEGTANLVFNWQKSSLFGNMIISSEGNLKFVIKEKEGNSSGDGWKTDWEVPSSRCDLYGFCGPYGVCKQGSKFETCECLRGFVPRRFEQWIRGNWSDGCLRQRQLLCERNNSRDSGGGKQDGFQKISMLKLPDFYDFVSVNLPDDCRAECASRCACVAYAFVGGIGCLVWSQDLIDIQEFSSDGKDLFLRLSHQDLEVAGQKAKIVIVSVVAAVSGCVLIVAIVLGFHLRRDKRSWFARKFYRIGREDTSTNTDATEKQQNSTETQTFDFDCILIATNHFSHENKLGQGGYGPVYKGKLNDGKEIAVKRLSKSSKQGIEEFKNEATLISKLQHRNLVRLIGCCTEKEEKILIYEFMPNKSLDVFIFDPSKSREIKWETRFNIILGVAKGLLYLHRDSCLRIIHRDLKVGNILLDDKMNPKISDFGLSRIFEGTSDIVNTHKVVGTIGYMSPEYALAGNFSEKSDVFSFGVLILEIVSSKKNTSFNNPDNDHLSLISYAWQLWNDNTGLDLVDDSIADSCCWPEVTRCIHVGLLCVQDHAEDRPTMPDVVFMLSNETNRPQPRKPTLTIERPSRLLQRLNEGNSSVNEVTISICEGR